MREELLCRHVCIPDISVLHRAREHVINGAEKQLFERLVRIVVLVKQFGLARVCFVDDADLCTGCAAWNDGDRSWIWWRNKGGSAERVVDSIGYDES